MTRTQFRRWYSFAIRMARHGWPEMTERRRKKLVWWVEYCLEVLEEDYKEITDWDSEPIYVCDRMSGLLEAEHYHDRIDRRGYYHPHRNRFLGQVESCVRAGLDVACEPSAGVLGFTVGDLRRMYPRGLPAWIAGWFTEPGPITAETPDALGVWL